jgi:hypothetical protein
MARDDVRLRRLYRALVARFKALAAQDPPLRTPATQNRFDTYTNQIIADNSLGKQNTIDEDTDDASERLL